MNALWAALAMQSAAPALAKQDGGASVVLFSSVAVAQGFTGHASIAMAKGAIEGAHTVAGRGACAEGAGELHLAVVTRTPLASKCSPIRRWRT